MTSVSYHKTVCPLDCPDSCGMIATVRDGKVVSLAGDPQHPYSKGVICRKMRRFPQRLHGPDRLRQPLRRSGAKGEGRFQTISWEAALDEIADRLTAIAARHGASAILPFMYAGNMGHINRFAGYPLFHRLGTSLIEETICSATASAGWRRQCGAIPGSPPHKAAEADLIVVWGCNVKVSNLHFWPYIHQARQRGGQLVVIDPYRNQTAESADLYLPVRPGGDAALAVALLKALQDLEPNRQPGLPSQGWPSLLQVIHQTPWAALVESCGIEQAAITDLARLLAETPKTFFRLGVGLSRNSRGAMSVGAITSLAAYLDLFASGPGRGVLLFTGAFHGDKTLLTWPQLATAPQRRINMIQVAHALTALQPRVHALINYNANPVCSAPDSSLLKQGLLRDDLFTVVHEQVMTPTARYADLLLPATTFLENHDCYTAYGHFYLATAKPVIAPVGEARSNFDFFQHLARRLGFTEPPFGDTCEERLIRYLGSMAGLPEACAIPPEPGRYLHSILDPGDSSPLQNSDQPFDFHLGQGGFPPAGVEFDDPDLSARYPLLLLSPPHPALLNSTFGEDQHHPATVLIHPADGQRYAVVEGQRVRLHNHRGATLRRAHLTVATQPGVVVAEGLFWAEGDPIGGVNALTSQKVSDLGGGAVFHECRVAVEPV